MNPSTVNLIAQSHDAESRKNFLNHRFDFCVVGGGISGMCAALAAARRGLRVALLQNRSVLGGNASSEIRQHIGGASFAGHYADAREGGIVDELWTALRAKAINGSLNDYAESSTVFLEKCLPETNLQVFLNVNIEETHVDEDRIVAVEGLQSTTGIRHIFEAKQFADCSGDAVVAYQAGASFRRGQEGKAEFEESLAPDQPTLFTMGNTILFQTEKMDKPVPYERPDWVPDLSKIECYWTLHEPKAAMEHGCWLFEYGGQLDTITDADKIQFELLKIVYAAWADLKRRPECGMQNHRLSFLSSLPGKRESRRIVGDHVLTENDIVRTTRFEDDVSYAGWALDLHPPGGFYGKQRPTTFHFFPEIHSIPLRCLYSKDLGNLWMAGRNVSATHVALGGLRLMASCGLMGEAIGIAAAVSHQANLFDCRTTTQKHAKAVQQDILRGGGFIPGIRANDPHDAAPSATIASSSEAALTTGEPEVWTEIGDGIGIAFPITAGKLQTLKLPISLDGNEPAEVRATLQPIKTPRDFHATTTLATATATAHPGEVSVTLAFGNAPLPPDLYMVHIHSSIKTLKLGATTRRVTGVHVADFTETPDSDQKWDRQLGMPNPPNWVRRFDPYRPEHPDTFHQTPCFEMTPPSACYAAGNVVNGINRPTRLPNIWVSKSDAFPQRLEFTWDEPQNINEISIVFDADMDLPRPPIIPPSTLVKDYTLIGTDTNGSDIMLAEVNANRNRLAVHSICSPPLRSFQLVIRAAHLPGTEARVCEVRTRKSV
ncbi:MAG: FAD-dependent oxidoreductase [Verrucomicrobia bacterium]|nr:FAD-dependent oxidoreductase [Verrucomicrobiota bacterium]